MVPDLFHLVCINRSRESVYYNQFEIFSRLTAIQITNSPQSPEAQNVFTYLVKK